MNDQIWYHTQQLCYDACKLLAEGTENSYIFIARDIIDGEGKKQYTSFKSTKDYLKWLRLQLQSNKNCHEQIRFQHCEFYDIDQTDTEFWKKYNSEPSLEQSALVLDDFFNLYNNWLQTTDYPHKQIFNKDKHALILQSSNPNEKISYHIIMRHGYLFNNIKQTNLYMTKFIKYLEQQNSQDIIDCGIYTKNRCFRTIHCSKANSNRILQRSSYNKISQICDESLFFVSNILPEVTMASDISCLSLFHPYTKKLNIISYNETCFFLNYIKTLVLEEEKIKPIFTAYEQIDLPDIEKLLNMLNISRATNRADWMKIGWILYNSTNGSEQGYKLWNDFSKKCPDKYNETKCITSWECMNVVDDGVKIGSLRKMAEEDNLEEYKKFLKTSSSICESTFETIHNIPKKKRTKEQQDIYDKILIAITNSNLDKLTKTTLIEPIIKTDEWVTADILLKSTSKINIIKAGLGRGKSQSVSDFIKKQIPEQSVWDNIIVLTPRRSYAKSAKERLVRETLLEFICYLEYKKSHIDKKYVVIQAESLYRLQINIGNTLVIIDEIEAFLSQLTSTETHGKNHVRNIETFMQLIKNSNKVIALDAFVSNRTLKTFISLSGINNINFFLFTQQLKQRKAVEIDNIDKFIESLLSDLEKGKKIFLFSSSNTKLLKTVKKTYVSDKKEDKIITALLPAIREKYPNKNIIEFHSKYMTIQLTNVNSDWKTADLVACTSTITVGCNFDTPNVFNKVYLYANASSRNLVRDMFQASWRVRHLIDDEMVYCLDTNHYGLNLTTNIKQIELDMVKKNDLLLNLSLKHNLAFPNQTPEIIKDLLCFNKLESNMSIMSLKPLFERYLNLCNYKKEDIDMDSILEVEFDEFFECDIEYNDIPEITPSKCKELSFKKKTIPLLELESLQLEKYFFQNQLLNRSKDVEEGLWKIYNNFGKGKFKNISIEKGFLEGTCTIQDIIEKESYSHFNSGLSLRFEVIKEINQWIGMKNTSEYGFTLNKDKLDNIIKLFENNREKIHLAFDMRDGTKGELNSKTTIALINKILDRWSFSTLKSTQKKQKVKGKVIDNSEYIIQGKGNNNFDIAKEIKPYKKSNFFEEKSHPLLLHKDDKKFITDEELEKIRLNKY